MRGHRWASEYKLQARTSRCEVYIHIHTIFHTILFMTTEWATEYNIHSRNSYTAHIQTQVQCTNEHICALHLLKNNNPVTFHCSCALPFIKKKKKKQKPIVLYSLHYVGASNFTSIINTKSNLCVCIDYIKNKKK